MVHKLEDHPYHPDDSHQMVHMLMGNKDMTHIHPVISGMFQLVQDGASSASVYHEILTFILYYKACVVAFRRKRISCPSIVSFISPVPFIIHIHTGLYHTDSRQSGILSPALFLLHHISTGIHNTRQ